MLINTCAVVTDEECNNVYNCSVSLDKRYVKRGVAICTKPDNAETEHASVSCLHRKEIIQRINY